MKFSQMSTAKLRSDMYRLEQERLAANDCGMTAIVKMHEAKIRRMSAELDRRETM